MPEPASVREALVVDHDPTDRGRVRDVTLTIEVPPKATSGGWGQRPGRT